MYVYFPCFFRGDLECAFNLLTSTLLYFLFLIIPISFNFVIGFFSNLGECGEVLCIRFIECFSLMNTYDTDAGRNL